MKSIVPTRLLALCAGIAVVIPTEAIAQRSHGYILTATPRGAVTAVVSQFELAYMHQDKQTMLMRLMVPTNDAGTLEKRYQWLRGYGPTDMPGSVHPPILFKTSKGSFVPKAYTIQTVDPIDDRTWHLTVRETGSYHDEDGRYSVKRVRQVKVVRYHGKWYISDYYLKENSEDYGFYVDDISDQMTHIGK